MEENDLAIRSRDTLHAFQMMVLVNIVDEALEGIVVVGKVAELQKGIIFDLGSEVPELQTGDLVYFTESLHVEDDAYAVHYQEIISYKRYE